MVFKGMTEQAVSASRLGALQSWKDMGAVVVALMTGKHYWYFRRAGQAGMLCVL